MFRLPALLTLLALLSSSGFTPLSAAEVVHVFVALCDNASQGILPVPPKIGDGDKPDANLYWGCSEGVRSWFKASKHWRKVAAAPSTRPEVLERAVFKHTEKDLYLVADAWRGREIRSCLQTFVNAAAGEGTEEVKLDAGGPFLLAGGASKLVAYIGHNGLMEFTVDWPKFSKPSAKPAIVLCCVSQKYFSDKLKAIGAIPALTTTQLMYPGAFVLHDALEAWISSGFSSDAPLKAAAAKAYARNQSISVKAAGGVFVGE